MKLADFPNVAGLTPNQKLELVDELWLSIAGDLEVSDVSDVEKRLLDERWAAYEKDPSSTLTVEQLKAKLAPKFGLRRAAPLSLS
jgi:putative addiction module component (TIGR02574 family)